METVVLEYKDPDVRIIEHRGYRIEVYPFIEAALQVALINKYLETFFGQPSVKLVPGVETNRVQADYNLRNQLFQTITNIDTRDLDRNFYIDEDLWRKISREVTNYKLFMDSLEEVLEDAIEERRLENSIGKVISDFAESIEQSVEMLSKLPTEGLKEITESNIEMMEQFKNNILPSKEKPKAKRKYTRKSTTDKTGEEK